MNDDMRFQLTHTKKSKLLSTFLPHNSLFTNPFPDTDLSIGGLLLEKHLRLAFIQVGKERTCHLC